MNIYVIVKYEDSDNAQSAVLSVDNLLDYVRNQFDYTSAEAIIAYVVGDDYEHWFTRTPDNIRWQALDLQAHHSYDLLELGTVKQETPDPNAKQHEREDWEARYRAAKQTAKGWS